MYSRYFKRALDVVVSALLLALLSPLLAATAVAIRAEDGGPVVFRQRRVGRHGAPFTIFKFRSMPPSTPTLPSAAATKLTITRVGKIIRRTNVDELPQLYNVLRGDMSIVGPRPALPSQRDLLDLRGKAGVLGARPGITGLAQIRSYDRMPDTEKVEWERLYVESITFMRDLRILFKTAGYLLRPPPVY
jgi:lipopolysaccharide/colanic/teichoic acid biosynthesis glycosyltransferase